MERSLSILLPIHNAQATLYRSVHSLLELAAELTERFDLLIVDDGSTDHSIEVARELAWQYPQVKCHRHASRQGLVEVIRSGLARTSGEIVCLHEGEGEIDLADLHQLWQRRNESDLVLARRWGPAPRRKLGGGFHLLRREALTALADDSWLTADSHEVRFRRDAAGPASRPRRPSFLSHLCALALGTGYNRQ